MLRINVLTGLALVAATSLSATAGAVTIDFENLSNGVQAPGTIVYPEATFTSSTGRFFVNGAGMGKDICTYGQTCDGDLTVEFSGTASNLSFQTVGDNSASTISYVVYFGAGGTLAGTFKNDGNTFAYDMHSFGALSDIAKISFTDDDFWGLAYDNFTFDFARSAVPEPASWAMMIGGFALAGASMRRRAGVTRLA